MQVPAGAQLPTPPAGADAGSPTWVWALLVAAAVVACFTDLRSMRIPNWLTLPLLAAGLVHAGATDGWHGLLLALGSSVVAGLVFIIGYAFFRGGAGDAKLMLAIGSWVSFDEAMLLMLAVTIAGFFQALVVVWVRGSVTDIPLVIFHGWWRVFVTAKRFIGGRFAGNVAMAHAQDGPPAPEPEGTEDGRIKGWFPYAPAILLGTVGAWWYTVKHGGLG